MLGTAADVLRAPMHMFLVGAGAVCPMLGERNEALLLSAFAMTSVFITVIQGLRSQRVLEASTDLTSPRASAIPKPREEHASRPFSQGLVWVRMMSGAGDRHRPNVTVQT